MASTKVRKTFPPASPPRPSSLDRLHPVGQWNTSLFIDTGRREKRKTSPVCPANTGMFAPLRHQTKLFFSAVSALVYPYGHLPRPHHRSTPTSRPNQGTNRIPARKAQRFAWWIFEGISRTRQRQTCDVGCDQEEDGGGSAGSLCESESVTCTRENNVEEVRLKEKGSDHARSRAALSAAMKARWAARKKGAPAPNAPAN